MKIKLLYALPKREVGFTIFRLLVCFLIIRNMFLYFKYSELLFGKEGIASYERYEAYITKIGLDFLKFPFEHFSPHYFLWVVAILAFLFALGIGKHVTGILLYLSILNLNLRNHLILDGSDNIILVSLPFLIFGDTYRLLSFGKYTAKLETSPVLLHIQKLAALGFMLQISIVYFVTGLVKLNCDVWQNGTANHYILQLNEFKGTKWNEVIADNVFFTKASTYFTLTFEILFPAAIFFRVTRYTWLALGVIFHLGIWIFMKIDVFPWIMIATYFVFIDDESYYRFLSYMTGCLHRRGQLKRV